MPEIVLKNAYVRWGTSGSPQAVSTNVRAVTIDYSVELLDKTAMGSSGRARIAGLKDWAITIEFNQDFATTTIDKEVFNMIGSTGNWIAVRPTTANRGAGSPDFIGEGLVDSYSPISQSIGDLITSSVTFTGMDGKALSRNIAAT